MDTIMGCVLCLSPPTQSNVLSLRTTVTTWLAVRGPAELIKVAQEQITLNQKPAIRLMWSVVMCSQKVWHTSSVFGDEQRTAGCPCAFSLYRCCLGEWLTSWMPWQLDSCSYRRSHRSMPQKWVCARACVCVHVYFIRLKFPGRAKLSILPMVHESGWGKMALNGIWRESTDGQKSDTADVL